MRLSTLAGAAAGMTGFLCAATCRAQYAPVYSSLAGPYDTFGVSTGLLGYDDYTTSTDALQPKFPLYSLQFHGSVTAPNTSLTFIFNDALGNEVATFSASIPTTAEEIWTIQAGDISIPTVGQFFMRTTTGTSMGEWDLTTTAPSIGTNSTAYGTGPGTGNPTLYNSFSLNAATAPEVDTCWLLGLGLGPTLTGVGFLRHGRGRGTAVFA